MPARGPDQDHRRLGEKKRERYAEIPKLRQEVTGRDQRGAGQDGAIFRDEGAEVKQEREVRIRCAIGLREENWEGPPPTARRC